MGIDEGMVFDCDGECEDCTGECIIEEDVIFFVEDGEFEDPNYED